MAVVGSLRIYAFTAIIMEIFFAVIYAFQQGVVQTSTFADFDGLILTVFLSILLLVGFGLTTVYIRGSALTGLFLNFIMLAFTIQWYFLMKKFWYAIKVTDSVNSTGLSTNPYNIRFSNLQHYDFTTSTDPTRAAINDDMQYFTVGSAIACAISMFVALSPLIGRVGPGEALTLCFLGNIGYTFNEAIFWRLGIQDNGYSLRIFLYGSTAGIITSIFLGRRHSDDHQGYTTLYSHQTLAFLGAIFVWILMPWLSVIEQSQITIVAATKVDYRQVAPMNVLFALASSSSAAFFTSVWMRGKIAIHDVTYACFSGAIAYGASSNVFPNPFPGMLIGSLMGIFTVFFNSKKVHLNQEGVIDTNGAIFIYFIPSLISGLYSSILYTTTPYGATNDEAYAQIDISRSRFAQGGYQLIGTGIVIVSGILTGLILALVTKLINRNQSDEDVFNDQAYLQRNDKDVRLVVLKAK